MTTKPKRTYHGALDDLHKVGMPGSTRFESTGEVRSVRPGEWYISGARPCAYRAPRGLLMPMLIARIAQ